VSRQTPMAFQRAQLRQQGIEASGLRGQQQQQQTAAAAADSGRSRRRGIWGSWSGGRAQRALMQRRCRVTITWGCSWPEPLSVHTDPRKSAGWGQFGMVYADAAVLMG
jgi:hypothetical protein